MFSLCINCVCLYNCTFIIISRCKYSIMFCGMMFERWLLFLNSCVCTSLLKCLLRLIHYYLMREKTNFSFLDFLCCILLFKTVAVITENTGCKIICHRKSLSTESGFYLLPSYSKWEIKCLPRVKTHVARH